MFVLELASLLGAVSVRACAPASVLPYGYALAVVVETVLVGAPWPCSSLMARVLYIIQVYLLEHSGDGSSYGNNMDIWNLRSQP